MVALLLLALAVASAGLAPLLRHESTVDRVVNGAEQRQYIILFNHVAPQFGDKATLVSWASQFQGVDVLHYYRILNKFHGFSAWLSSDALVEIRMLDMVELIEEDQEVSLDFTTEPQLLQAATRVPPNDQWRARIDWGQKRINSRPWALETKPTNYYNSRPPATYAPPYANTTTWDWVDTSYKTPSKGELAVVWIVDTGVRPTHDEFKNLKTNESRVTFSIDFVGDGKTNDGNGHGTHCAGTAAGNYRGVAPEAEIRSVRVLNDGGSGTWAGVIAGFDWVANNQVHGKANILSASLGGGATETVDRAANSAVTAGVIVVVAAGNSNNNACGVGGVGGNSPARAELAITVVASDSTDTVASFSSFGPCCKSIAPGVIITSAWIPSAGQTDDDWYNDISGTSMATPHVAGAIAVYVSEPGVAIDPDSVKAALAIDQTPDLVLGLTGTKSTTPNVFLYSQWKLA